jgi:NhaA family Na+:H+ antiporter
MLLMMSMLAIILVNSRIGPDFEAFWASQLGITITNKTYSLSLLDWINDGLLCLFFLVVSLEIKREFTVGRLSSPRAAALPIMASFGGVVIPALIYLAIVPSGPLYIGWGTTISTDTAFAIALIVMLGNKVPVELRIFLTAAAIVDDLISIGIIALFYSETVHLSFIFASISILLAMIALNRWNFYNPIPYALLGIALWICLYRAGLHPTLTGVLVALIIPTSPPANLMALNAQAQALFKAEALDGKDKLMRNSPSPQTLRILDTIHDRIESPASKLLRTVEPWSSYLILPLFALANAGVVLSFNFHEEDLQLMLAIFLGLVVGKPIGIYLGSWLAIEVKLAEKPAAYTWHQLLGAAVLAGMGFTMSLFIASHAFPISNDLSAAKIAIFAASITAGLTGSWIIYRNPKRN